MNPSVIVLLLCLALQAIQAIHFEPHSFEPYGVLPVVHACGSAEYFPFGYAGGKSASPALRWSQPPADAQSAVIVMHDADAEGTVGYSYLHWVVVDLPVVGLFLRSSKNRGERKE